MSSHKKTYVSSRSCTLDLEPLKDLLVGVPVEIVGHDESATIDTELSSTTAADRAETDDRLAPGCDNDVGSGRHFLQELRQERLGVVNTNELSHGLNLLPRPLLASGAPTTRGQPRRAPHDLDLPRNLSTLYPHFHGSRGSSGGPAARRATMSASATG